MSAADLCGDDDEFGEGAELARETCVEAGIAKGEAHSAVCGHDFKEHREESKSVVVCVFKSVAFDNGNEEETQEDEPEIKRQLAT